MCIFSSPVNYVGQTRVLVSVLHDGWHATICGLEIEAEQPTAVYFPVPAASDDGDQSFLFVDLSDYVDFFKDLDQCFANSEEQPDAFAALAASRNTSPPEPPHPHQAWFLRGAEEIKKLPPDLQLDRRILNAMPAYWDCGFAVFSLQPKRGKHTLLPMAYAYRPLRGEEMFFPTVQAHQGEQIQPVSDYDHILYYQQSPHFGHVRDWQDATRRPCKDMKMEKLSGLLEPESPVQRLSLFGNLPNCDQILKCCRLVEPEFRSPFDLPRTETPSGRAKLWDLLPDDVSDAAQ